MNEKQIEWTLNKCNVLIEYMEDNFPLSDEQWESVAEFIGKVVSLAKGNTEVRSALFDTVEPYQKKAEELIA